MLSFQYAFGVPGGGLVISRAPFGLVEVSFHDLVDGVHMCSTKHVRDEDFRDNPYAHLADVVQVFLAQCYPLKEEYRASVPHPA